MGHKIRIICSICDLELPERNASPAEVFDVRYVSEPHRGCKAPAKIGKKPVRIGGYDPEKPKINNTTGETSVAALDGTGLTERPAPAV